MGKEKNRCKALAGKTEGSGKVGHMFREEDIIKMYIK
jgi:hypothetical protein